MTYIILILLGLSTAYYIYRRLAKEAKEGKCATCKLSCSQKDCQDGDNPS